MFKVFLGPPWFLTLALVNDLQRVSARYGGRQGCFDGNDLVEDYNFEKHCMSDLDSKLISSLMPASALAVFFKFLTDVTHEKSHLYIHDAGKGTSVETGVSGFKINASPQVWAL